MKKIKGYKQWFEVWDYYTQEKFIDFLDDISISRRIKKRTG